MHFLVSTGGGAGWTVGSRPGKFLEGSELRQRCRTAGGRDPAGHARNVGQLSPGFQPYRTDQCRLGDFSSDWAAHSESDSIDFVLCDGLHPLAVADDGQVSFHPGRWHRNRQKRLGDVARQSPFMSNWMAHSRRVQICSNPRRMAMLTACVLSFAWSLPVMFLMW